MESHKLSAVLFILMFFISTTPPLILGCGYCSKRPPKSPKAKAPKKSNPPITFPPKIVKPPVIKPPVTLPPVITPPITLPPVITPPITLPPVVTPPITLPPVVTPPVVTLPPIVKPPITLPPVIGGTPPVTGKPGCNPAPAPAPATTTCPIDTLKLGSCVDLLGGLVHIGLGDPVANTCCPILQGLVEFEAAMCLCTTIKLKLLNLDLYLPLALQVLEACGETPPPGFTCTL